MKSLFTAVYLLHSIFNKRQRLTTEELMERLGCSRSTFMNIIKFMRERLDAPIIYDRFSRCYQYRTNEKFELPGTFFTEEELLSIASIAQLLKCFDKPIFNDLFANSFSKIKRLCDSIFDLPLISEKIRLLPIRNRSVDPSLFKAICTALLSNKRLLIEFPDSSHKHLEQREISPLHILYYKDNWYLDAFCHSRNDLRTFSLHFIATAQMLNNKIVSIPKKQLKEHFSSGYGLFSGAIEGKAVIKFEGKAAHYARTEIWHPDQEIVIAQDHVLLTIPYSNPIELISDIARWGHEAEILNPPELREKMAKMLKTAVLRYEK